jgi:hypothetical protein
MLAETRKVMARRAATMGTASRTQIGQMIEDDRTAQNVGGAERGAETTNGTGPGITETTGKATSKKGAAGNGVGAGAGTETADGIKKNG